MNHCSSSMAPDDEELLVSIFGEATLSQERKQHIEQCPACQQWLKDYQQTHNSLLSGLYRTLCPSPTQLSLYCENKLPIAQVSAITNHMSTCLLCSDEVKDLRYEIDHFLPFPKLEPETQSFWHLLREGAKVLVAQLITPPPEMALRLRNDASADNPSATNWPYEAGKYHLSFQLLRTQNDTVQLIGFFENLALTELKALEGVVAALYATPPPDSNEREPSATHEARQQPVFLTTVDDLGNFSFAAVPPGSYIVIIHLPDTELVVEGLPIT